MMINLAVQVLNGKVGNVLNNFGPEEAAGTRKFRFMIHKFLNFLNVKNTREYIINRKPFLKPYKSIDDIRFAWFEELLNHFTLWPDSIKERDDANY